MISRKRDIECKMKLFLLAVAILVLASQSYCVAAQSKLSSASLCDSSIVCV
jgi:hypothetical protein